MLPPAPMLAIKKLWPRLFLRGAALIALGVLAGCTPPGPRALLQGDRLVQKGRYQDALEKLKTATELLPAEPRAWNCLGLAYQGLGDNAHAVEAYRHALTLDRSNLVFVARYNLGCAYLEAGNPAAAVNELRSYSLLSNTLPALLKLGTAEMQSRQFDAAERTFAKAMVLRPGDAAAQNGLGLAQVQRNRSREAAQWFQSALKSDPKFGPALLNLAVLYHQQPAQRAYAVQKYREYLALEPRPANYEAAKAALGRLEQELAAVKAAAANVALVPTVKTNIAAVSNVVVPPLPVVATQALAAVKPVATNLVKPVVPNVPVHPLVATNTPRRTTDVVRVVAPPVAPKTNVLVSVRPLLVETSVPPPVVVVALTNEPRIKPAPDIVIPTAPTNLAPAPAGESNVWIVRATPGKPEKVEKAEKPEKRSIWQSLNPFRSKEKPAVTNAVAAPTPVPTPVAVPAPEPAPIPPPPPSAPVPAVTNLPVAVVPERPPAPRYTYHSIRKPVAGDRKAAEMYFQDGLKAHLEGKLAAATSGYQAALEKDPAHFEACYNLGLLASQVSDWKAALHAYETALAINPDAVNARLNLGQALERSDFPQDAANELEKVVTAKPEEARAHLTLGNIYAQKLGQTAKAREHYLKVLELEPYHSQASVIRFWLAAHP